jgi:chromate transporter
LQYAISFDSLSCIFHRAAENGFFAKKRALESDSDRRALVERELFVTFLTIGLSAFGGALPWARRILVEREGAMTAEEFNDTLSLCQSLPGPNVVNLAVIVGARSAGSRGALSALAGLVGAPVGIVLVLATLYSRFGETGRVPGAINALGAAASGLVWATAAKMAQPLVTRRPGSASATIALAFLAIVWLKLPLPAVLAAFTPIGVGVVWLGSHRARAG